MFHQLKKKQRRVSKEDVINLYDLKQTGGKGWYTSMSFKCPECGKGDGKFGAKLVDDGGLVNCWRCGYKTSIFTFLYESNNYDIVETSRKFSYKNELENKFLRGRERDELEEQKLPIGFERITDSDYLDNRGFKPWQYEQFGVGKTDSPLEYGWKDKIIFQIFNNGKRVATLGRSKKSKSWHDENMQKHKEEGGRLVLRYKNSETDFERILGGLDDITCHTDTVIIVEGLFDKANIDRIINVNNQDHTRCVFTFGSKISKDQIDLLKSRQNVSNVIIFYDAGTLKKVREYVSLLQQTFDGVFVAFIDEKKYGDDIDAGDISPEIFAETMVNMMTPDEFYLGCIKTKKIRL